jgi:hypothetical protein
LIETDGTDPHDTLIEMLQRELDLRNREVARLHEVIGRQAMAAIPEKTTRQDAPEAPEGRPQVSGDLVDEQAPAEWRRGFWDRLLGR